MSACKPEKIAFSMLFVYADDEIFTIFESTQILFVT